MIIIKVLVDEMPSGCKRCNYCVAKMYCLLLEDRKTTVPDEPYKRRPDCPLVYDFSDKQINDLTARITELETKIRHNALWQASEDAEERAHLEKLVPDLKKRIAELEESDKHWAGNVKVCMQLIERYESNIAELEAEIDIRKDQLREAKNILIDKNLQIDSLYEEGYKLQQRIVELEGEIDQLTAHDATERQDDKWIPEVQE